MLQNIPSMGRELSASLVQEASQCIHKISKCHWIIENEHKNPIISRVDAPTKVIDYIEYG